MFPCCALKRTLQRKSRRYCLESMTQLHARRSRGRVDHPARGFQLYALPLARKNAAEVLVATQTIVGQVNSEFQGDVTRVTCLGAVSRIHGDSAGRLVEERSENGPEARVSR